MIPYGKQSISSKDIDAVVSVLKSDWLTQGSVVPEFEQAVAHYCAADYAYAVSHGSAALHLACRALSIGAGDWVWTSPNSFVASANCVLYCGAKIDFVDIDPYTYNLSVKELQKKLLTAEREGKLPKALIAVHFAGQSCDMQAIRSLSEQYGFYIIEDAAHAVGGSYLDSKVGSCAYADIAIFSFHPVKIITTGEGGMLLTNNKKWADKIELLRSHGITRDSSLMLEQTPGDWYYEQIELGYNYRMTDFQAALGLSQLQELDRFIRRRTEIASFYQQHLADLPLSLPLLENFACSSWHLYVIRLNLKEIKVTRKQVFEQLRESGIGVHVHYIPVHTQPYYCRLGFNRGDFPEAELYYREVISLPVFYTLSNEDLIYIVKQLRALLLSD